MSEKTQKTIGRTSLQRKNMKTIIRNKEYLSMVWRSSIMRRGKIEKRILEPSNGGMGIKLKIAKIIFINTTI